MKKFIVLFLLVFCVVFVNAQYYVEQNTGDTIWDVKLYKPNKAKILERGTIDVAYFQQCGQTWSGNILGNCTTTICQEGCAMTSTAMLLKTNGCAIDPGTLNTYLKNNSGYSNGCLIVWSKACSFSGSTMSYVNSYSYSLSTLKSEIDAGDPVIVRVLNDTHFIVVKGYTGTGSTASDFLILDPYRPTATKLSQNGYNPTSMRIFNNVFNPLKLNSAITYSPNPIIQNQSLTVTVSIKNSSGQTFTGDISAALHTTGGTYLGDIAVLSNQSIGGNATKTFTFTKSQITSSPGSYKIYLKKRITNGSWSDVNPGSYSNPITVTIVPPCLPPSGGYANNVTKNSARINWNLVSGALNIKLEYKKSTASSWTVLTLPGNYYYNVLTGLQSNTNYVVRLKTVCSSTSSSSYSANITFKTSASYKSDDEEQQILTKGFDVKIFPNPSHGFINLEIYNTTETIDVIVTNLLGQICVNEKVSAPYATIDATELPKGIYTIVFKNKEIQKVEKIIIE